MAEELAHHGYPISSGTLYPLLHRMETADASKPGRPIDTGLARRLGTADAVVIGLGSIIGAGVFAAFAPAAAAAGTGLLIGLAIAGFVAYCNATSSAALAATYPTSGGTYLYGRDRLGPWWGFTAGWGFVIGKTASCAAMASPSPRGCYSVPAGGGPVTCGDYVVRVTTATAHTPGSAGRG